MLTSFFATSKPINYITIIISVILFTVGYTWFQENIGLQANFILVRLGILVTFLATLGVLNFVVKRNTLTRKNTYILFFFCCFTFAVPICFTRLDIILSGLFVFMALRRILSMRSQKELKKKIFDAAFWILIASLFYFWSILFMIVLYIGILFHARQSYKHAFIPFVSLFIVGIFCIVYALFTNGIAYFVDNYIQAPIWEFTPYSNLKLLLPISFFLGLYIWCVLKYLTILNAVSQKLKPSYTLILISSLIALVIAVLFAPVRDGSELYLIFGPLAIIASRYIEMSKGSWFKEMILWMSLLIPILIWTVL